MKISRIYVTIFFCSIFFIVGIFMGRYMILSRTIKEQIGFYESDTAYKFINPLLFCQDQNLSNQGANYIEHEVSDYIMQEKNNNDLIDAAFYFKDLNGGPWSLVNQDYRSAPSSLLKVPIALSVYQRAERDPAFLRTKITLPKDLVGINVNENEHFAASESVQPDTAYTVEDLVRFMLQYSDNTAVYMLSSLFTLPDLQSAYSNLGIDPPSTGDQGYTISVKTFGSFFRVLYNGTYLDQKDSEHVLSILSQSTFKDGLVAGLPQGMMVAHKFGETSLPNGTIQLNDCGIVYKPNQPYLVCVMTKGTNYDILAKIISRISKMLYDTLVSANQ